MPSEDAVRIVRELARRGYNADREAVTLLAGAPDPTQAIERAVETAPDDALVLSADHVATVLDRHHNTAHHSQHPSEDPSNTDRSQSDSDIPASDHPSTSGGNRPPKPTGNHGQSPVETKGSVTDSTPDSSGTTTATGAEVATANPSAPSTGTNGQSVRNPSPATVSGDIQSTGTGTYRNFVSVFRDKYERLAAMFQGRVNYRPAAAVADESDGSEAALVGMVASVSSTSGGHLRFELEDTSGTYPCLVLGDRSFTEEARTVLCDEVIAVEGRISKRNSDDEGILFVDDLSFPDIPRTNSPSTADRPVRAALVSDIHVGSQEFLADAWTRFADWLHTDDAADVEYLLIAGDMVEGIGVYPNQDKELDIIDIYDQYEQFSEHLKDVPGDMEIVMVPGNHDAVRLAEPQPAFDEELRSIMSAHDATISANPSTVTIEGVSILMYHGVSLDEVIAEIPGASYDDPAEAMTHLLRKRHVAPQYGGKTRIAPEKQDHLVIDEVPDIFHAGHVHKFGHTRYRGVLTVNSSCWQSQTDFQESVNLNPEVAYAPIVDLQTLELQYGHFL